MIPPATAGLSDDAQVHRTLENGRVLLGSGWRCIDSFDDINDDAYEDEEEEVRLPTHPSADGRNTS